MKNRFKLSPPWCTYVNYLTEMFGEDPEINVRYDNDQATVYLAVDNADKYDILVNVLPCYKTFGNMYLNIEIIPSNNLGKPVNKFDQLGTDDIFNTLFKGNPVFSFVKTVDVLYCVPFVYVVFKNKIVQFFNDNLNDVYGNMTTLYQYIAEEIFDDELFEDVCFCTDISDDAKVAGPLGEWP